MRSLADGRPAVRPPPSLDELRQRRDDIVAIAAAHGASEVRVFGSVALGEQGEDSDLDLLVRFEPGRSLFDQVDLILALEERLGCAVEVVSEGGLLPDRFGERVRREAVAL